MTIRTILAPIPTQEPKDAVMASAIEAAKVANAHLVALAVGPGERSAQRAAVAAAQVPSSHHAQAIARAAEEQAESTVRDSESLKARFEEMCAEHDVPVVDDNEAEAGRLPSASWIGEDQGRPSDVAKTHALAFDLTVAGSGAVGRFEHDIAIESLRSGGRPVLLAPLRFDGELGNKVVIAWDASPECWHAVAAAMPFLQRANEVSAISVANNGGANGQERLVRYLAWHGVETTARTVKPGVRKIDDAILSEASDQRAGLLVMGARMGSLRAMLGRSITHSILGRVAATPVLMAH